MSTIDSLGLISAITFGRDILWRIQSPTTKDQEQWNQASTGFVRRGLGVTSFIALGLAFSVPSVVNLWYGLGSILVPGLVLPFLLSFKNIRPSSGMTLMMVAPVTVGAMWMVIGNFTGGYPLGFEPFYPGMLVSIFIYFWKAKS